jgi:hypothetical protein
MSLDNLFHFVNIISRMNDIIGDNLVLLSMPPSSARYFRLQLMEYYPLWQTMMNVNASNNFYFTL